VPPYFGTRLAPNILCRSRRSSVMMQQRIRCKAGCLKTMQWPAAASKVTSLAHWKIFFQTPLPFFEPSVRVDSCLQSLPLVLPASTASLFFKAHTPSDYHRTIFPIPLSLIVPRHHNATRDCPSELPRQHSILSVRRWPFHRMLLRQSL
jgi:hypothetical protein